jgi:3-phosphoshikimate 1-carboxyvinyltransferase
MSISYLKYSGEQKEATIHLPASKSISNRLLILQALSKGSISVDNVSDAEDTIAMQEMLNSKLMIVNANEAGTALRFATAYFATQLQEGEVKIITAAPSLRVRPIADLVVALQSIGCNIEYADTKEFAPLQIIGVSSLANTIEINANTSSQFVSALCMVAPTLKNGLEIHLKNEIVSEPYIAMTLSLLQECGIEVNKYDNTIRITHQQFYTKHFVVENDWSAASFFYCALLLMQSGSIALNGLQQNSIQGDSYITELAKLFGIDTQFNENGILIAKTNVKEVEPTMIDASNFPDMAIPFIVACAIQYPQIQFTGLSTLLVKESNRVEALQTELRKIGIEVHFENEILSFSGKLSIPDAVVFSTYQDHRIAMALSLVALISNTTIAIDNPEVVNKSFPTYWKEIQKLGIQIQ